MNRVFPTAVQLLKAMRKYKLEQDLPFSQSDSGTKDCIRQFKLHPICRIARLRKPQKVGDMMSRGYNIHLSGFGDSIVAVTVVATTV